MAGSRKRRAVAARAHGDVPEIAHIEQIMERIFMKLPVTSLPSCKQALKQWYELITKPHFTRLHFNSNLENNKLILYLKPIGSRSLALHLVDKDAHIRPYTVLRRLGKEVVLNIVSFFNGLMCCSCTSFLHKKTLVINPATRKILKIPYGSVSRMNEVLGVVFDVEPAKYKIVRFYSMRSFLHWAHEYSCEVYCPERESWSQVGNNLPCPLRDYHNRQLPPHLCVGGRLYWFVWRVPQMKMDHILSIGMDEVIRRVELPAVADDELGFGVFTFFINYRGSLGIFYLEHEGLAGIYSLVDPDASEWRFVRFVWFEINGPLKGINSIVEIDNELLFVLKVSSDEYFHFWFLNLDTMLWREAETGFVRRRVFRPQQIFQENFEAMVFPFNESSFKCKGE